MKPDLDCVAGSGYYGIIAYRDCRGPLRRRNNSPDALGTYVPMGVAGHVCPGKRAGPGWFVAAGGAGGRAVHAEPVRR